LVISTGIVDGVWNGRWQEVPGLQEAVARLESVPDRMGDWVGENRQLDQEVIAAAHIAGYRLLDFNNKRRRQRVTMLLICGQPGPVAVHTPDVCYEGAGYQVVSGPVPYSLLAARGGSSYPLNCVRLEGTAPQQPSELRVLWSWNADGCWEIPAHPRFHFARFHALYKLYVMSEHRVSGQIPQLEDDAAVTFLKVLLPALDRALALHF
jgi:hypothetical protein